MFWKRRLKKVKCRDKSVREVYIDPNDAFPLWFGDTADTLKATAKALEAVRVGSAELSSETHSQIRGLLLEFDGANRSIQLQFRAVYETYKTNPCSSDNFLKTEISKIIERESFLRHLQMEADQIKHLLSQTWTEKQLTLLLRNTLLKISIARLPYLPNESELKITNATVAWGRPVLDRS
jgi:hypothetical protein